MAVEHSTTFVAFTVYWLAREADTSKQTTIIAEPELYEYLACLDNPAQFLCVLSVINFRLAVKRRKVVFR